MSLEKVVPLTEGVPLTVAVRVPLYTLLLAVSPVTVSGAGLMVSVPGAKVIS